MLVAALRKQQNLNKKIWHIYLVVVGKDSIDGGNMLQTPRAKFDTNDRLRPKLKFRKCKIEIRW